MKLGHLNGGFGGRTFEYFRGEFLNDIDELFKTLIDLWRSGLCVGVVACSCELIVCIKAVNLLFFSWILNVFQLFKVKIIALFA